MSTDEQMHARLQNAGARWRARAADSATGTDAGPSGQSAEPLPMIAPDRPPGRRGWTAIAGGIVAAAAVAAGLVWLASRPGGTPGRTAAGDGDRHGSAISIAQIQWQLTGLLDAHGKRTEPARPATFFLDPSTRQLPLVAGDGCNTMSGPATLPKSAPGTLRIGDLATTAMACPGAAIAEQQDAIHAILSGTVDYSISGTWLTITKDGAGSLIYQAQAASRPTIDPSLLAGVPWALSGVERDGTDGGTASGSSEFAQVTLQFDGAGHATLRDGCVGTASVVINAGSAEFGRFVPDKQVCTSILGPDEQALVARILDGALSWSITDDTLTVTKAGTGALTFERGAAPTR